MARCDRETRINRLTPYRWKPGQSGNAKGRPKKEHELRFYLEGVELEMKIPPEFYRNAMVICGMQKQIKQLDEALASFSGNSQHPKVLKVVPSAIRNLRFGEYSAMRAGFDAAKDPVLFLKVIEQIHGKPVQPTTIANPDGAPIKPSPRVLIINVPAEEDDESRPDDGVS